MENNQEVKVKNIEQNSKIPDLENLGELVLNFGSSTRRALERISGARLTRILGDFVENEEMKNVRMKTNNSFKGDFCLFYKTLDKRGQMIAELCSYFPYFLREKEIKYGNLVVHAKTKQGKLPLYLEEKERIFELNTNIFTVLNSEFEDLDILESENNILNVYILDNRVNAMQVLEKLNKNAVVILSEKRGNIVYVQGFLKTVEGKVDFLNTTNLLYKIPKNYLKELKNKTYVDNVFFPYLEAERRSEIAKKGKK